MRAGSTSEFILMVIRPAGPNDDSRAIRSWKRGPQGHGRHDEPAVPDLAGEAGQVVEQLGEVRAEVRVARQQAEVLVEPGRRGVVVAVPMWA